MDDTRRMVLNSHAMERCNEEAARLCRELAAALEQEDQNVLQRFTAIAPGVLRIKDALAAFSKSTHRPRGCYAERLA